MRRRHLLALFPVLLLAGCDSLFGPKHGPPAGLTIDGVPSSVTVGAVLSVSAEVRDDESRAVPGATVSWDPSAGSMSEATSVTGDDGTATATWTVGTGAGPQSLTATAGDAASTVNRDVAPGPMVGIAIDPDGGTMESIGDTLSLTAAGQDQYGNALPLQNVTWSSSSSTVATVQGGVVVSKGDGTAWIRASAGAMADSAAVVVSQVAVGLRVNPGEPVMVIDETLQLEAREVDARGHLMGEALVTDWWESSQPGVASVDGAGLATAVAAGTTQITAGVGTQTAETALEVRDGVRPSITGISPAVLAAGDTATITGAAFSTTPSLNSVTVDGMAGTVVAATAEALTVVMPPPGTFPCGPTFEAEVVVDVDGLTTSATHPLAGATQLTLSVGGSAVRTSTNVACNELTEPGDYVISVFNAATTPSSLSAFQLRGTGAAAAGDAQHHLHIDPAAGMAPEPDPVAMAHLRILEESRRVVRELYDPATSRVDPLRRTMQLAAAPAVGDTRVFRIPDIDGTNLCNAYIEVTARAAYVGEKGVAWEDVDAPLAGTMDTTWARIGAEVDNVMYPILLANFGDPLAYNADLQADGVFHMVFSHRVNAFEAGVAGFVFSGDFLPRTQCTQSNHDEVFYARAPTATGTGYNSNTIEFWSWTMRSTIIHEIKHLTAYAHKFRDAPLTTSGNPNFEASWLEESTARLSEEFYARTFFGYGQHDNVQYAGSIYCEVRPNWEECAGTPAMMQKHFSGLNQYLRNIEDRSPLGSAASGDASFYGSGWMLVRWAIDHSGLTESAFAKAIVDELEHTGVANLVARTGRAFSALLADFTLALAVDDHPNAFTPARAQLTHPGWDIRDIYLGLSELSSYDREWPLIPRSVAPGDFTVDVVSLRGGSASILELNGVAGPQLLELLSASGSTAPAGLGISIVRVK